MFTTKIMSYYAAKNEINNVDELADLAGIDRAEIWRSVASGDVGLSMASRIADALGVPQDERTAFFTELAGWKCLAKAPQHKPVPRMRYTESALEQLRAEDPETPVTAYMIKKLLSSGVLPSVKVGRRRLFNYDDLLAYLQRPQPLPADREDRETVGGIRRVDEKQRSPKG